MRYSGFADHRVQNPAVERSLEFPIIAAFQVSTALQMQAPANPDRTKGRPKNQGHRTQWIIHKRPHPLPIERGRFRISVVAIAQRTVGFEYIGAGPAMRNDLVKKGHDGDHRALGRKPEAAQGLEMFDRAHSVPSGDAAHWENSSIGKP
jgi:hypothetical protein